MPNKKAQQDIERELCKDSKFASYFELRLDNNRKLVMKETKSKGCYDENKDIHDLREKEDRRWRKEARRNEDIRRTELLKKKGIDPAKLGVVAAEVLNRIGEIDNKQLKEHRRSMKKNSNWYHPREHWWDLSESDTGDVPCKE